MTQVSSYKDSVRDRPSRVLVIGGMGLATVVAMGVLADLDNCEYDSETILEQNVEPPDFTEFSTTEVTPRATYRKAISYVYGYQEVRPWDRQWIALLIDAPHWRLSTMNLGEKPRPFGGRRFCGIRTETFLALGTKIY